MNRLLEMFLGLPRDFLSRQGDLSVRFNPVWPWQESIGAGVWNLAIIALFTWLIVYVYRREGRDRRVRIILGVLRGALVALVLLLLNRPVVTLTQNRVEPSVVAVMIDDSLSMRVRDIASTGGASTRPTITRLDAVLSLLGTSDAGLLRELSKEHELRLYRFDRDARIIGPVTKADGKLVLPEGLVSLTADGQATSVGPSVVKAVGDLAGQRVAGVVLLTDGRDSPARPIGDAIARLRESGVKLYSVEVGGDAAPRNLSVDNVIVQDSAFKGDLVTVKTTIRGTGFPPGSRAAIRLVNAKTKKPLTGISGPAEQNLTIDTDQPREVELTLKPEEVGELELAAVVASTGADSGTGEVDDADNSRTARLAVLDTKVNLLYIEGYPRWDYRFLRTEMIRDKTVDVSILLTSADSTFAQDGDRPIRRLPESMEELLQYDVVLIGDVDPRQFTDAQLQLLADFVSKKGGGLAMVAGPRFAPARYRSTPLESVLPVNISRLGQVDETPSDISVGFRPVVTPAGTESGIFRFLPDRAANDNYLKNDLQMVFWYLRGITVKPGAGEVLAEHPTEMGPDGKKAPILVAGRYGAGRTLFSSIDDSWRWRYYTGESVFDTYWVQQIRMLARGRKLGQRLFNLTTSRSVYELGEQVTTTVRVLETNLLRQLPNRIDAEVRGDNGELIRQVSLSKQEDRPDTYVGAFPADRLGRAAVRVGSIAPGAEGTEVGIEVIAPRLELADARLDRTALQRLSAETMGQTVKLEEAARKLPPMIASAAKTIPMESSRPLWDAPLAMLLFVLLVTAEWVTRKLFGMV